MACGNACPVNAISYPEDEEGFRYPSVDAALCVNCGRCESACPYRDPEHGVPEANRRESAAFFAARLKDTAMLDAVSSGGVFQALAETVIREGGVVYGAAQEDVDRIFHIRAETPEELKRTRRSKYLQSDMGTCYRRALADLRAGRTVLFSGTGCQIAGLNAFLGKPWERLYTCEVVCHGVPSRKVWQKYREEKEAREGKPITDLVFRDKSAGWSKNQYRITYGDGSEEYERSGQQLFHAGYLKGLFYRPSCGSCPFASMPRTADITLADYWKYAGPLREGDRGVSLAAVSTGRGRQLLERASGLLDLEPASRESALDSCRHMDEHPAENRDRRAFIAMALERGYYAAAGKYIRRGSLLRRAKRTLKSILGR